MMTKCLGNIKKTKKKLITDLFNNYTNKILILNLEALMNLRNFEKTKFNKVAKNK